MIWSCLAADGVRSKREEADMGLDTDKEPCWDWPGPSMAWVSAQLFSPASGLLMGDAWQTGAAAIGWRAEVCRGGAALWPFGE